MKNEQKPASFIYKLCAILKTKQHSKTIIWDPELKGIRILHQKKLEETVLPRYYRHNRFSSFVRQLNMYDFHKIPLENHKSIFCHQHFDPRKKETIYIVKRKVTFNMGNSDKISSAEQKQIDRPFTLKQNKNSPDKQNLYDQESIFRQFQDSIKIICDRKSEIMNQENVKKEEQVIQELIQMILNLKLNCQEMKKKLQDLRKNKDYRKYLRRKKFNQNLYSRLGLEYDNQAEKLSELSIEGQMLNHSRKTLTQKSLRLFESVPILRGDSIGNLMSLQI